MFRQLSLITLAISLAACGSDSSDQSKGISSEVNPALKGPESQSTVSDSKGNIADGAIVSLNTRVKSSIASEAHKRLSFSVNEDQLVAIVLSGDTANSGDLDLEVSDNQGLSLESSNDHANEGVVVEAKVGVTYTVDVESYNSFETGYTLTLASASRSLLQISSDEFGVVISRQETEKCGDKENTNRHTFYSVANFKEGYVRDYFDAEKQSSASATGNTLNFKFTVNQNSGNGDSFSSELRAQLTVNPETGILSGTGSGSRTEVYDGTTEACTFTFTDTGKILI